MKKLLATFCILGSMLALSACTSEGEGYKEEAPYAAERTAGHEADGEQVFRARQVK
jgi:hypothetical protein